MEYGSSFGAMRAAGTRRTIKDAIVEMNAVHLSRDAVTVFESLEDAGLTAAAVNTPCYRGRTRHLPTVPGLVRPVDGPRRFFYFSLFESDVTGAPLALPHRRITATTRSPPSTACSRENESSAPDLVAASARPGSRPEPESEHRASRKKRPRAASP